MKGEGSWSEDKDDDDWVHIHALQTEWPGKNHFAVFIEDDLEEMEEWDFEELMLP